MIKIPTCLVLGAGASIPYGFPSGIDLRKTILYNLREKNEYKWHDRLFEAGIVDEDLIKSFYSDFHISSIQSIDRFLELRPDYYKIGKLAIALALIPCENHDTLFRIEERPGGWYSQLYNKLSTLNINQLRNNQLKIITFNYDRSLEHFLFNAIKHTYYGVSADECAAVLATLDIIHVNGKLGNLPWQGDQSRPYKPDATIEQYKIASKQIKIVSEQNPSSEVYQDIFKYLWNSQRILFLGFGFDETNFDRLRIESIPEIESKEIWGTAFRLGQAEIKLFQNKWPYLKFSPNDFDISEFFKEVFALE